MQQVTEIVLELTVESVATVHAGPLTPVTAVMSTKII